MSEVILIDDKYESECPACGSTNITADDVPMSTYRDGEGHYCADEALWCDDCGCKFVNQFLYTCTENITEADKRTTVLMSKKDP